MKKRLLITSIVMMLVVAVALSTATYAWFTSNTQVTASTISMTAGTSSSSALGIAWDASSGTAYEPSWNAAYGTTLENIVTPAVADDPSTENYNEATFGFQPAAPVLLNTVTDHTAPVFKTAFINAQSQFLAAGTVTPVYRYAEDSNETPSNLVHVANLAQSGAQTVYLTATITGTVGNDGAALIRIAVYEVTTTTTANDTYTYKGLLGASAGSNNTAMGDITGPTTVEQTTTPQLASSLLQASTTTELNLGSLAAQTDKAYAIYVWLDGAAFDEAEGGKSASIALTFSTARTSDSAVSEING